jgi:hypothetical protein
MTVTISDTDRGGLPYRGGFDRHFLAMLELRRKVSHEIIEGCLLRHHSLNRTAEKLPREAAVIDALPPTTRLTGAEECDIPRVASWLTLRADGPKLVSHEWEVKSTGRGEGG